MSGFVFAIGFSWDNGPRFYVEFAPDEASHSAVRDQLVFLYDEDEGDVDKTPMGFGPRKVMANGNGTTSAVRSAQEGQASTHVSPQHSRSGCRCAGACRACKGSRHDNRRRGEDGPEEGSREAQGCEVEKGTCHD